MRKIPVTMATQHPDNACPSPFNGKRFVSTNDEIDECVKSFSELGVHEYMWDWEGKLVDEAVIDRLFRQHYEYFKKNSLGKDLFLTFRIPNIWEEKTHRLPRAFMNIFASEHAAVDLGMHSPPIFEMILPMTTSSSQLIELQKKFMQISEASSKIFDMPSKLKHINLIPLLESVETMADVDILEEYVDFLENEIGEKPEYLRVFIARSDPAMNAGLIPTMLSVKHALSNQHEFGKRRGIKIYPWIGGGSLPFRGAINPENIDATIEEYKGASSLTIQTAFRSDYPMEMVKKGIKKLNKEMPQNLDNYLRISEEEGEKIKHFNKKAAQIFQSSIESLAPVINQFANKLPSHRERVQHVGLFGYARGVGKVTLPRAIKFCGAFYSLGIPPEFIASGRVLALAKKEGMTELIEKCYINIKRDFIHAGKYLNKENLNLLAEKNADFLPILEDIKIIEEYLGQELGPTEPSHFLHRNYTSNIYQLSLTDRKMTKSILNAAEYRKSLG